MLSIIHCLRGPSLVLIGINVRLCKEQLKLICICLYDQLINCQYAYHYHNFNCHDYIFIYL